MKLKKLLAKTQELLDRNQRERKTKRKHIKKVLKQLRRYEDKLSESAKEKADPLEIEKLQRKISLVHAQRKKGIILMQELSNKNNAETKV